MSWTTAAAPSAASRSPRSALAVTAVMSAPELAASSVT
jgi:hypothetical protein